MPHYHFLYFPFVLCRDVVLTFDAMSIEPSTKYVESADEVVGFEDLGGQCKGKEMAKSLLVFMIRGISRSWKQPIAYHLTTNGLDPDTLRQFLVEILVKLHQHGVRVSNGRLFVEIVTLAPRLMKTQTGDSSMLTIYLMISNTSTFTQNIIYLIIIK
jgi:hypothetical protein